MAGMFRNLALGILVLAGLLTVSVSGGEKIRPFSFGAGEEKSAPRFPAPELEAKSVYVLDLKEREIIFEKDSSSPRPLASLTKLLTALLLEEMVPEGFYIPIGVEDIRQEGDDGFRTGDSFQKEDLRDFMLVASSNDAAYAAAQFIGKSFDGNDKAALSKFAALMNERARELGMSRASFLNPHGLDVEVNLEKIPGAWASAVDVALLTEYIFKHHPNLLERTSWSEIEIVSQGGRTIRAKNTNQALAFIPQLVASKTGFTDLAGGNLVFIFDAGFSRPVLAVLLGSSEEGRFSDAKKITEAVLKYYQTL